MSTPLNNLGMLVPTLTGGAPTATGGSPSGASGEFSNTLSTLLSKVEESSGEANDAVSKMIDGTGDVHSAMIALQHADVMLQLTVQVRNKLVQAYQDVMRMPV